MVRAILWLGDAFAGAMEQGRPRPSGVAHIKPSDPRYCPMWVAMAPHEDHEFEYSFTSEISGHTTGRYLSGGAGVSRFRTQAVIRRIVNSDTYVEVRFPAAPKDDDRICLPKMLLPEALMNKLDALAPGEVLRTHCVANLDAIGAEELRPSDWEIS
jgi:hypothetical protein